MRFSIIVYGAPEQSQAAWSAYRFAVATLAAGHQIYRVFFFHEGVYNGVDNHLPAQDEASLPHQWQTLGTQHALDLVVCVSAARRRGVFDEAEGQRHQRHANLLESFTLSGLGQYTDALLQSDRTITFGH